MHETAFSVEGDREFPFEMLRYDHYFPATGEDSTNLHHHARHRRTVRLRARSPTRPREYPTRERWKSFHWIVVDAEETP